MAKLGSTGPDTAAKQHVTMDRDGSGPSDEEVAGEEDASATASTAGHAALASDSLRCTGSPEGAAGVSKWTTATAGPHSAGTFRRWMCEEEER